MVSYQKNWGKFKSLNKNYRLEFDDQTLIKFQTEIESHYVRGDSDLHLFSFKIFLGEHFKIKCQIF